MRKHQRDVSVFFIFLSLLMLLSGSSDAQTVIKGGVSNEQGQAIPLATVNIKGSGFSTLTDEKGIFNLTVPLSGGTYILLFSSKGYKSFEKPVNSDSLEINVALKQDVLNLDEVVVTGNAINTTKKKLGNSISTIGAEEVKYAGTGHLSGILNGRIMGGVVTQNTGDPGGGFSVKLRGVGSVFGSSEPLYIVDGVIMDNSSQNIVNLNSAVNNRYQTGNNRLIDINPHDIEHIEVINGPAAAAIYGSRASNGVVQIFTKKGKRGKPEVVFSSSLNYNSQAHKIEVNNYPFRFGIQQSPRLDAPVDRRTLIGNFRTDQVAKPGAGPQVSFGFLDTSKYPVTRYDYQDKLLQPSWGTDQHLSISGGGEKGDYYLAGSYLNNGGIMVGTGFTRYGLKISSNYELNDWIKVGGGLMYTNSKSTERPNSFDQYSPLSAMNHTDNVYNIEERDSLGNLKGVEYSWVNPLTPIETYDLTVEL